MTLLDSLALNTSTVDGHTSTRYLTPDSRYYIAEAPAGLGWYWGRMPNCMTGETGERPQSFARFPTLEEASEDLASFIGWTSWGDEETTEETAGSVKRPQDNPRLTLSPPLWCTRCGFDLPEEPDWSWEDVICPCCNQIN
jgi:hypothetical protein